MKYNKVIILTDGDVDGKHIQNLLLTFFINHMPELIESGNLYIGTPPLYSIRESGKIKYILDDIEYRKYINDKITKEQLAYLDDESGELYEFSAKDFRSLFNSSLQYKDLIQNISLNFDIPIEITEGIITYVDLVNDKNSIEETLNQLEVVDESVKFEIDSMDNIIINGFIDENYINIYIDDILIEELLKLQSLQHEIFDKFTNITDVRTNLFLYESNIDDYTQYPLAELIIRLEDKHTPKTRSRIKGLGEMDPDQLYNTTLDPKRRNLIKVTMDDIKKALEVNNELMGSKPELRRDFIEEQLSNALLDLDLA